MASTLFSVSTLACAWTTTGTATTLFANIPANSTVTAKSFIRRAKVFLWSRDLSKGDGKCRPLRSNLLLVDILTIIRRHRRYAASQSDLSARELDRRDAA